MIRRAVIAATLLAVVGGTSATAFASSDAPVVKTGEKHICLGGTSSPNSIFQGICIYIPFG